MRIGGIDVLDIPFEDFHRHAACAHAAAIEEAP